MSDLLKETELRDEPIKKPAKAWQNWWRATHDADTVDLVTKKFIAARKAGEAFTSSRDFPSKEIAEWYAQEVRVCDEHNGWQSYEYLGAYPEGERP